MYFEKVSTDLTDIRWDDWVKVKAGKSKIIHRKILKLDG
jgi:hypothetical protein